MRMSIPGGEIATRFKAVLCALAGAVLVSACGSLPEIAPAEQPLAKESLELIAKKGMSPEAPIFIRIFKEESELEVWKARDDGRFYHFKTYPICNWSGELGPKQQQGDKQAPEGFYTVGPKQMNPNSKFYLAFNIGYPNAYDRAHGYTGEALMIHGKCKSAGCYAMTDALAEEIYALARESFRAGQPAFEVHAFPFRMTDEKMVRFKGHKWYAFWQTLKQGYDYFEANRVPPGVAVCERRYVVNVALEPGRRIDANGRCPRFERPRLEPFAPRPQEWQLASERITVPGPKTRNEAEVAAATALAASEPQPWQGGNVTTSSTMAPLPPASALGFNP